MVRKEWRGREVLLLSFVRRSPCFPTRGIHFKDRRNISIGCKGDSRRRFSAGQLAKGCTKSCPDISRVYQSQCGSGVPDTATLDAARSAHRRMRQGEAGRKNERERERRERERRGEAENAKERDRERNAGCGRRCCRCTAVAPSASSLHPVPPLRSGMYRPLPRLPPPRVHTLLRSGLQYSKKIPLRKNYMK